MNGCALNNQFPSWQSNLKWSLIELFLTTWSRFLIFWVECSITLQRHLCECKANWLYTVFIREVLIFDLVIQWIRFNNCDFLWTLLYSSHCTKKDRISHHSFSLCRKRAASTFFKILFFCFTGVEQHEGGITTTEQGIKSHHILTLMAHNRRYFEEC